MNKQNIKPFAMGLLLCVVATACADSDQPDNSDTRTPIQIVPTVATIVPARSITAAGEAFAFVVGDEMKISYSQGSTFVSSATYTAAVGTTPGSIVWNSTTPICWEDLGTKGDKAATAEFRLCTFGSGKLKNGTTENTDIPAADQSTLNNYLASDFLSVDNVKLSKVDEAKELSAANHRLVATLTHQCTDVVANVTVSSDNPTVNSVVVTGVTFIKSDASTVISYKMPAASGTTAPTNGSGTYRAIINPYHIVLPGGNLLSITYTKNGVVQTPMKMTYTLEGDPKSMPSGNDNNAWGKYFTGKRLIVEVTLSDNSMSATAIIAPWTERTGNVEIKPDEVID